MHTDYYSPVQPASSPALSEHAQARRQINGNANCGLSSADARVQSPIINDSTRMESQNTNQQATEVEMQSPQEQMEIMGCEEGNRPLHQNMNQQGALPAVHGGYARLNAAGLLTFSRDEQPPNQPVENEADHEYIDLHPAKLLWYHSKTKLLVMIGCSLAAVIIILFSVLLDKYLNGKGDNTGKNCIIYVSIYSSRCSKYDM